jgi:hypothetical protein
MRANNCYAISLALGGRYADGTILFLHKHPKGMDDLKDAVL